MDGAIEFFERFFAAEVTAHVAGISGEADGYAAKRDAAAAMLTSHVLDYTGYTFTVPVTEQLAMQAEFGYDKVMYASQEDGQWLVRGDGAPRGTCCALGEVEGAPCSACAGLGWRRDGGPFFGDDKSLGRLVEVRKFQQPEWDRFAPHDARLGGDLDG